MKQKKTMRAAVLTGPRRFELADVACPEPASDQILIRLEGSGLCGSNLPAWQGRPWFKYPFEPGAPGHEGWGVVTALGNDVHGVKEGDRVAALSYKAFADYDVANTGSFVILPPAVAYMDVPGEPLACCMNIFARSDIRPGQRVAVVGIGFLGAVLVQLASRAGAEVIAISHRPFSLEVGRHMGAKHVFEWDDPAALVARVRDLTGDDLCDRVIEATGHQKPLDLAAQLTRVRGRLVIAGFHQDGRRSVDMQLWNWRGLDVVNAHERDPAWYVEGMRSAVNAMVSGSLEPQPLLTHRFGLENIDQAFQLMEERPRGFVKSEVVA